MECYRLASGSRYHVASLNDHIAGGAGIFPSPGLPDHVCELVKMYLAAEAREETVRGNGRY
jgi:putative acetyltransferase